MEEKPLRASICISLRTQSQLYLTQVQKTALLHSHMHLFVFSHCTVCICVRHVYPDRDSGDFGTGRDLEWKSAPSQVRSRGS